MPDRRLTLRVTAITFTLLPQFAVGLRVVARRVTHQHLWWDDWLVIVAALSSWLQFAFLEKARQLGQGRHEQTLPPSNLKPFLVWTYCSEIWYTVIVSLVKCSILCLYIRLFRIKQKFIKLCYGMIVFVLAWLIGICVSTIFQCTPVKAAWTETSQMLTTSKCVNLRYWTIGNNVPNILADLVIIIMPIPLVWSLKLSMLRKLGLCFTFHVAFIATIISIARVVSSVKLSTFDVTWAFVNLAILSTAEGNVGVVCACLPTLAPLIRMALGKSPNKSSVEETLENMGEGSSGTNISNRRPAHTELGAPGESSGSSRGDNFIRPDDASDTEILWSDRNTSSPLHGQPTNDRFPMGPIRKVPTIKVTHDSKENDNIKNPQIYPG